MRPIILAWVIVASACAGETATVPMTKYVATLGFATPPKVALVTRGEGTSAWSASLRAATSAASVVAELSHDGALDRPRELCEAVAAASGGQHVDEILVVGGLRSTDHDKPCIDQDCSWKTVHQGELERTCVCRRYLYKQTRVRLVSQVAVVRASDCRVVSKTALPDAGGSAPEHDPPIDIDDATIQADEVIARREADLDLERAAARYSWNLFPRTLPTIEPVEAPCTSQRCTHAYRLRGASKLFKAGQSYWVKKPTHPLRLGAQAKQVTPSSTTLETTGKLTIEARDELHETEDQRRATVYFAALGGTVRADGTSHSHVGGAAAMRWSFDIIPVFAELRFEGALIGFDVLRTASFGGTAGFRLPATPISPVAFIDAGGGKAWQSPGASAIGGYFGLGVGGELWLANWFAFADIRRRWHQLGDWRGSAPIESPDQTWVSMVVQLGFGTRF